MKRFIRLTLGGIFAFNLFACSSGGSGADASRIPQLINAADSNAPDSTGSHPDLQPSSANHPSIQFQAAPRVQVTAKLNKQKVSYKSKDGSLTLVGYLYKPDGDGPFPTIIWNHGSEDDAGNGPSFDKFPEPFVNAGFAFFAPIRRGQGDSEGTSITEVSDATADHHERNQTIVNLMQTEQLDDQVAGLNYAKGLPFIDKDRMVVMGCSYGGIQTFVGAAKVPDYKAAVALSPGAESWKGSLALEKMLSDEVPEIKIPMMIMHPAKDDSLEPGFVLAHLFADNGQNFSLKIFPALGDERGMQHCFGGGSGVNIWAPDAITFINKALKQ